MILVNVGAEVHAATGSAASAATVAEAVAAIDGRFRRGADIPEMVPADPADADTLLARHRQPGHVLEACWFLAQAADLWASAPAAWPRTPACWRTLPPTPAPSAGTTRAAVSSATSTRGAASPAAGVPTTATSGWSSIPGTPSSGGPTPKPSTPSCCSACGRAARILSAWHERLHGYVFRTFPAGPGREWVQIRDRDGAPLDATVALPVKDPFHVARALLLLVELLADRR